MLLTVGTVKGLFRFRSDDRHHWIAMEPVLAGSAIYTSAYNPHSETLLAGVNNEFYGPAVRRSRDLGATWDTGGSGLEYSADDEERVTRVWSIRPVSARRIYAGVEASGLFVSDDGGDTWSEVASLRAHPTHSTWVPGFGGKCLHTIAPDPFDEERLYVACSTGGCYRTDDGGATWRPANRGVRADFMPEDQRYPESGQCVHRIAVTPARKDRMWLQNHGGVYRSDDGGESWDSVGETLPDDFGFGIVAHRQDADRAYVIPLVSSGSMPRWVPGNVLRVYRTTDGGSSWTGLHQGLPDAVYSGVLRDAFTGDGEDSQGLYFGTTSGDVYASPDEGEHWVEVARHLPRVLSVVATPV
ncbi:MAG: WD40/YVTN/BNR-like repeat-containing protein [Clostridia bacterium]